MLIIKCQFLSIAFHPSGNLTAAVLYHFMLSIYEQTRQGQETRSRILAILKQADGLTRNELVQRSELTYQQVRRQTQNLNVSGVIESRLVDGQRRYFIREVKVNSSTPLLLSVLLVALMPILATSIDNDDVRKSQQSSISS